MSCALCAAHAGLLPSPLTPPHRTHCGPQSATAAADWAAARYGVPVETCRYFSAQFDNAIEAALAVLPLLEWWYSAALRRNGDAAPSSAAARKKTM